MRCFRRSNGGGCRRARPARAIASVSRQAAAFMGAVRIFQPAGSADYFVSYCLCNTCSGRAYRPKFGLKNILLFSVL